MEQIRFIFQLDKELVQLPVNPEFHGMTSKTDNKSENIIGLGEVTVLGGRKLRETSVSSYFPRWPDSRTETTGKFKEPEFYIEFFDRVMKDKTPIRLIVTGIDVNMLVTVEEFNYERHTDDVTFDLKLKEYINFRAKEVKIIKKEGTSSDSGKKGSSTTKKETTSREKKDFSVGDTVICNGRYYHTSYAGNPSYVFSKNYEGVISIIVKSPASGQTKPIHISNKQGGWIGWVSKDQLKHK